MRLVRWTVAGWAMAITARLVAADAPADGAPPAPAPAAPPSGTWYVFSPPKEGEVVPIALRVKLLGVVKTFIERDNPVMLSKLTLVDNPFYLKLPPPAVAATSTATGPAEPLTPPRLTDEDKLRQVATALKPTGLIEAGKVRIITFAARDPIQVGQSFPVPFPWLTPMKAPAC